VRRCRRSWRAAAVHTRRKTGTTRLVAFLEPSWPPSTTVAVRHWKLDSYAELKLLRAALHEALLGEPVPADRELDGVPQKMLVVATELATNALTHARPPTVVQLGRTDHTFILDVTDDDPTAQPKIAASRPLQAGGRGLRIARELALDIGWYTGQGIKHIWAEFSLPPR
jgi:serine/threonine-protein kinase RsbW